MPYKVLHINDDEILRISAWNKLREGDECGLFELHEFIYSTCISYGLKHQISIEDCKDHLQQLFMELWEKRSYLPEVERVGAYLFTCFKRKLLRHIETKQRQLALNIHSETAEPTILEKYEAAETLLTNTKVLHKNITSLPERQQQLIYLRFYKGLSYKQIETFTGLTCRTIYNKIHEAVKTLRTKMR